MTIGPLSENAYELSMPGIASLDFRARQIFSDVMGRLTRTKCVSGLLINHPLQQVFVGVAEIDRRDRSHGPGFRHRALDDLDSLGL